jgi:hypothetical protein
VKTRRRLATAAAPRAIAVIAQVDGSGTTTTGRVPLETTCITKPPVEEVAAKLASATRAVRTKKLWP